MLVSRTAILRWNPSGITVAGVSSTTGTANNLLNKPFGATLDDQNNVYVADTNNNRIQKYLVGATNGTTIAGNANGTLGIGLNDLKRPSQVVVDSNGNYFIADTYNQRIMMWPSGSASGTLVAGLTGKSQSPNLS